MTFRELRDICRTHLECDRCIADVTHRCVVCLYGKPYVPARIPDDSDILDMEVPIYEKPDRSANH